MKDMSKQEPGLFGQKHSSRDYTRKANWGKNIFNSSFPASLVAYMSSKDMNMVYLCVDKENNLLHSEISGRDLYKIDPLSDNAYYNYEAGFSTFEKYYTGDRENIDLVMMDKSTNQNLIGLEIKLTALPDNTTKDGTDEEYSCEIVVRPPTICFLACSICECYTTDQDKNRLRRLLNKVPRIIHWEEPNEVLPHYRKIEETVIEVAKDMADYQSPLIVQPVWKIKDKRLADDCLDVFVWSNLAVMHMCLRDSNARSNSISRMQRSIIWIYLMLKEYVDYDRFDYVRVIKNHSYGNANDKAFSIPGSVSHRLLSCKELTHPRINKMEIKNIILGGGQLLLSPERRFDAVIVNSPELFD